MEIFSEGTRNVTTATMTSTGQQQEADRDEVVRIQSSWMSTNTVFSPPSEKLLNKLKEEWKGATASLFSNEECSESWWSRLVALHNDPKRSYHTLFHLEEMIGYIEFFSEVDRDILLMATFFHDAIYDPKSGTNEEDSAVLFQEFCKEMGESRLPALENVVVDMILATKSHNATEMQTANKDLLCLLDIDMAVLGKDAVAYEVYAGLIRKEYIFVAEETYCEKRAEILEKFLEEKSIFCTPLLRSSLETRARTNLRNEVESLRRGRIPGHQV